jgi:hypothetical protein
MPNNYKDAATGFENWSDAALKARERELKALILQKSPMPATETDQDAYIQRLLQQWKERQIHQSGVPDARAVRAVGSESGVPDARAVRATGLERPTSPTPTHQDSPPVDGNELIQEVAQFIARYLQCSAHQRTLLALWVLHTYCYCSARVTPYLSIQSAGKQSGKTLCLQLLSLLCDHPALTSGGFSAHGNRRGDRRL